MSEQQAAGPGTSDADATKAEDLEARIRRWTAEEAEARKRIGAHAVFDPSELGKGPGIEVFRRMLAGELPAPPIAKTLDFTLVSVQPGEAVFQGRPSGAHYNPIGSVHGGYIATLLDSAVGCAVHTALPEGSGYTTIELKVNYVRAVTDKVGPLRAIGRVINLSRQIGLADGRLEDAAGRLYATASTTCLVFPLVRPAR